MSETYPSRKVPLGGDERREIARLVEDIQGGLQELRAVLSRVAEIPFATDGVVTRFEVRESPTSANSGTVVILPPTDPPTVACLHYEDGEYTSVVWPCDLLQKGLDG